MSAKELVKYNHVQRHYDKHKEDVGYTILCRHIFCTDGFRMSVQASAGHHCKPRINDAPEYTHWEVLTFRGEELLEPYDDGYVSWNVPTDVVNQVIVKHGGVSDTILPLVRPNKGK